MHKKIEFLLDEFKKHLSPIKDQIYSMIVHGSSVYSEELKKHQDIDLFIVLDSFEYGLLKDFKRFLQDFCKRMSSKEIEVYYSIAGSGRTSIEKADYGEKQVYRLEIYVSSKYMLFMDWKYNLNFPRSLISNSKKIMGEDILHLAKYTGDTENLRLGIREFNKLQWTYCSILEFGLNEEIIIESSEEAVFNLIRYALNVFGIKELRKDKVVDKFIALFPKESKEHEIVLKETKIIRNGKSPTISALEYLDKVEKLNNFIENKIYEKLITA